jgi:hypothetical protein
LTVDALLVANKASQADNESGEQNNRNAEEYFTASPINLWVGSARPSANPQIENCEKCSPHDSDE